MKNHIIDYRDRPEGSTSKLNTYSDGFKVLKLIFTLYRNYKPLHFFGTLASLLLVLSLIFFIPNVWLPYRATGMVSHFPTLIVCGFCAIAGILSFYSGLILDAIQRKEHREFEFRLQEIHHMKKLVNK